MAPGWRITLSIPEILKLILSFLSLRSQLDTAQLVCKQWYAVCKDLIPVSINWHLRLTPGNTDNDEGDTANKDQDQLELLFPAHHINIRVNNDSLTAATSQQRLVSWEKMMGVLSTLLLECDRRRVHPKLHTLHLREGILENFALQLPQVPRLANLATLRIDIVAQWDIIHLFTILRACPLLEEISVKPTYAASVPTRSTYLTAPQSFLITSLQEHDIINGSHALSTLTRLRTCCLYNIVVTEPALIAVLIASPRLSRLILFGCSYLVRQGGQAVSADDHGNSIIRLIGAHCPDLKSFHLSMGLFDNYGLSSREIFLLLQTFPHMEQCNLTDRVIGLWGLVQAIIVNRITTLNLLPTHPNSLQTRDFPLREILSTFEHLLHLRAPTVVYHLEDMDLFDMRNQVLKNCRGRPESAIPSQQCRHCISEKEPAARQYIWACRGLKTLHIAIDHRYYDSNSTESSLVLFGVLTRVCPRLQELYLKQRTMHLSLQGGLCLLTRLQDLERVRFATDGNIDFFKQDLFWMRPTAPTSWKCLVYPILHRRARKYLQRLYKGISPSLSEDGAIGSVRAEISQETGVDLKNLGHANDLFNWMEDYYSSFWIETPSQDIDASLPKAAKMEEWMRKMRPKVDFQLLRPPLDNYYNMTLRHY
ncbi:hypothetical protein F5H01DRAFT_393477 [Linnemannia elongata]|nr:hypothetical protein F5H01DRAFT_393477 [Linnemannia elongata]